MGLLLSNFVYVRICTHVQMYDKGSNSPGTSIGKQNIQAKGSISMIITFCLQIRERFKKRVRLVHPVASDGTSVYKRQSEIKDSS